MLVIAVFAALAVRFGGGAQVVGSWPLTASLAFGWALVLGLPIVAFVLERGRAAPGWILPLGALAGALPLLLLGASGVIGLYLRAGTWERAAWALERGMPIPAAGVIFWPRFFRLELQAVLLGLCCGLVWWLLVVRSQDRSRGISVLWALFALGTLVTVSSWLR
jgi:hypothetical protein